MAYIAGGIFCQNIEPTFYSNKNNMTNNTGLYFGNN